MVVADRRAGGDDAAQRETTQVRYLLDGNWLYMVPVFNVVAFCFSAQYIVPEMARGFADKPEKLPKAIMVGMGLTFCLLALVPLSVIASAVWIIFPTWRRFGAERSVSGPFFSANLFALCAMLTSYWGLGKLPDEIFSISSTATMNNAQAPSC